MISVNHTPTATHHQTQERPMSPKNPYELNAEQREAEHAPTLNELDKNFLGGIVDSIELLVVQLRQYADDFNASEELIYKIDKLQKSLEDCSDELFNIRS